MSLVESYLDFSSIMSDKGFIEASKYDVRLALGALILNRKAKW